MADLTLDQQKKILDDYALGKNVELPEGYKIEIFSYTLTISVENLTRWKKRVEEGESLPPELVGMLLGRAKPKFILRIDKK